MVSKYIFIGFLIYLILKILDTNRLLGKLSDDINDIKENMGLDVHPRTGYQLDNYNESWIAQEVLKGRDKKYFRERLGLLIYLKWRSNINTRLEWYPNRRICPKCNTPHESHSSKCHKCGMELTDKDIPKS